MCIVRQGAEVSTAELEFRQELPPLKVEDISSLQQKAKTASKFGDYTYRELEVRPKLLTCL